MILTKIELQNFGPYYGRQPIELNVSSSAPVVLIHGENERGKTSFANAIRWCLYQKARGREGRVLPTWTLMNHEAIAEGKYNMSVRLEFMHDGVPYELERHAQASVRPTSDDMLQIHVSLKRAGNVLPSERVPLEIGDILHEDISRFFLFDGEMLSEYEDLLSSADKGARVVRESIERILGLPALRKAGEDITALRTTVERRLVKQAKTERDNERLTRDFEQKQEELQALERDLEENLEQLRKQEERRDQLRDEQRQFIEIEAEIRQLEETEKDIREASAQLTEAKAECVETLRKNWWLPMEHAIKGTLEEARDQASRSAAAAQSRIEIQGRITQLEQAISRKVCFACGQAIEKGATEKIEHQLHASKKQIESLGNQTDLGPLLERIAALNQFTTALPMEAFREKEARVRSLAVRIRNLQRREKMTRERIGDHDRTEIKRVQREYDECITQLGALEKQIEASGKSQREMRAVLDGLRRELRTLPGVNTELANEALVYKALEDLLRISIDEFRVRVRHDVEEVASEIHKTLTTEKEYAGIKIEENYGLILTNQQGRVITRSAGSEQIVALSLIGALSRCATREGPIVMDTPFGRLDKGHRANILKFAPSFGPQVLLLVQSGELERKTDLGYLEGKVGREYRIQRDGASDRSVIQPAGSSE